MKIATNNFRGMTFSSMSDTFILEIFDELCELTSDGRPHPDDWLAEWSSCKDEILTRMRSNPEAA